MEKTGCQIICGAPTTLAVNELMMMMNDLHKTLYRRGDVGGGRYDRARDSENRRRWQSIGTVTEQRDGDRAGG